MLLLDFGRIEPTREQELHPLQVVVGTVLAHEEVMPRPLPSDDAKQRSEHCRLDIDGEGV